MTTSVIIPAFNATANLERAVNSVLATSYNDLEIIIVEDGSSDGTLALAQNLALRNKGVVRVVQHDNSANRGVSASRNLGIDICHGEYVCFLDADDYLYPYRFDHALAVLMADPEVDAVYESTEMVIEEAGEYEQWGVSRIFGLQQAVEPEELLSILLKGQPWHPNAILCRRELLQKTGGFDENLKIAEDCNLWFRMAAVGCLVGGEFKRPVAAYCRHGGNTFYPGIESKVDMIRSMTNAYRWARSMNMRHHYRTFRIGISEYLVNALIVAREAGRNDLARTMLYLTWGSALSIAIQPRIIRQMLSIYRDVRSGKERFEGEC